MEAETLGDRDLFPILLLNSHYIQNHNEFVRYDKLITEPSFYVRGNMSEEVLKQCKIVFVVTHLWEYIDNPDPHQCQYEKLKEILNRDYSNCNYYIFYDFSSIPQKKYSPDGKPGEYFGATEVEKLARKNEQDKILEKMGRIYNGDIYSLRKTLVVDLNFSYLCLRRTWPSFELMTAQLNLTLLGKDPSRHVPPLITLCIKLILFLDRPNFGVGLDLIALFLSVYHREYYCRLMDRLMGRMLDCEIQENLAFLEDLLASSHIAPQLCSRCTSAKVDPACAACRRLNFLTALLMNTDSEKLFRPAKMALEESDKKDIRSMFLDVSKHGGSLHIMETAVTCEDDKSRIKKQWEEQNFANIFMNISIQIQVHKKKYDDYMNMYYPHWQVTAPSSFLDFKRTREH